MASGKYVDAEQALAELDQSPVVLKNFQGQDWELFSAMPAKPIFMLLQRRASGHDQDEMTGAESLKMMSEIVPPETFDAWLDGGLTIDQVAILMQAISAAYNGASASEEGEVVSPKPPKKGPTPSSKTGSR